MASMGNPRHTTSSVHQEVIMTSADKLSMLEIVGEGGFGIVHKAQHQQWGIVAYKQLPVKFIKKEHKDARVMQREASTQSALHHPNIVILIAMVFEPENYGVILEFLKYGGLHEFLETFETPWPWKTNIALDIATGMSYLHSRSPPVIHGDLKIRNILIGDGYRAKISDFGLSEWKSFSMSHSKQRSSIAGTVTHIAPEKWSHVHDRLTVKADVYAYGVLLWEIATQSVPFRESGGACRADFIRLAVIQGERPDVSDVPPDMPQEYVSLMVRSWSHQPEDRPHFLDIKDALATLVSTPEISVAIREAQNKLHLQEQLAHSPSAPNADAAANNMPRIHSARTNSQLPVHCTEAVGNIRPGLPSDGDRSHVINSASVSQYSVSAQSPLAEPNGSLTAVKQLSGHPSSDHIGPIRLQDDDAEETSRKNIRSGQILLRSDPPPDSGISQDGQQSLRNRARSRLPQNGGVKLEEDGTHLLHCVSLHSDSYPVPVDQLHQLRIGTIPRIPLLLDGSGIEMDAADSIPVQAAPIGGNPSQRAASNRSTGMNLNLVEERSTSSQHRSLFAAPYSASLQAGYIATGDLPQSMQADGSLTSTESNKHRSLQFAVEISDSRDRSIIPVQAETMESHVHVLPGNAGSNHARLDAAAYALPTVSRMPFEDARGATRQQFGTHFDVGQNQEQGANWNNADRFTANSLPADERFSSVINRKQPAAYRIASMPIDNRTTGMDFVPDDESLSHRTRSVPAEMHETGRQNTPNTFAAMATAAAAGAGGDQPSVVVKTSTGSEIRVYNVNGTGPGVQVGNNNVMYINQGTSGNRPTSTSHTSAPVRSRVKGLPQRVKRKIIVPDRVVSNDDLQLVSNHISKDWRALGRQLRTPDEILGALQVDYNVHGVREMAWQMLRDWHERLGNDAKLEILVKALVDIKRPDIALKFNSSNIS